MNFKLTLSKFLTNKVILNVVAIIAFLNVFGYMVMGNFNNVVFFIISAVLVRLFSKNMTIVLGIPLIIINLFSLKGSKYEGMENNSEKPNSEIIKKINDEKRKSESPILPGTVYNSHTDTNNVEPSNVKTDEHFSVGRSKNGGSKIDYASTIENSYDELNKVLGGEGIKNLTEDTQRLIQQQMELSKSMEGLAPLVEKMMPMAQQMQGMMQNMNTGGEGMSGIMDMAQKLAKGLGGNK